MRDSNLERAFSLWLRQSGIPEPVREHVFAPPRRWRLDFAWPSERFAVEIDGGLYSAGRHNRPKGYIDDCEKYEAAMLLGWTVYRVPGPWVSEGSTWVWRPETMAAIRQMLRMGEKRLFVNARPFSWPHPEIAFEDVVQAWKDAHPSAQPGAIPGISYRDGYDGDGILLPGEAVKVKDGTVFVATGHYA